VSPVALREAPERLDDIQRFRFDVMTAGGTLDQSYFPSGRWGDAIDPVARHWVLERAGVIVGCIRYAQFPSLSACPDAAYLQSLGTDLPGAIGLPERMVIHPSIRKSGHGTQLADVVLQAGLDGGARWLVVEAAPMTYRLMLRRGRIHLGPAPHYPHLPKARFELMVTDLDAVRAQRASGERPQTPN